MTHAHHPHAFACAVPPRRGALRKIVAAFALAASTGMAVLAAPAAVAADTALPDFGALLQSPLRTDQDRQADARRKPVELLRLARVRPGWNVLDVSAGDGYTTQLLALAVGPDGGVWAQNAKERPGLAKRLAAHPQPNIHPIVRPFDDPYPADAPRLDLITFILNYHDVANTPVDRAVMDRKLFAALKPGGYLVVVDHAAKAGAGLRDTKTLHRIEEATVVDELQQAGFVVEERADFLRNPGDPREQAFFDLKVPSDRFAIRLRRP